MKEKLHTGELYLPNVSSIMDQQLQCLELLYDYNHTRPTEGEKRSALLKEMFAEIGEGCYIEPPFHSNWGGHKVHFGKNVYANFHLTHIYVGDNTKLAPNVVLSTATHPINSGLRTHAYQYNLPIHIGKNCWLCTGVMVIPGVKIGDNSVIGQGVLS